MEGFASFISAVDSWVWGWPLIILLLGTHVFLTFRLGIIQRFIGKGIKLSVKKDPDAEGDVSQFAALTTALAATIGTGNIIGVGTALALGGPGAILWCWLTGVFGIATKYAEGLLACKYRVKTSDGTMLGGPMYALERGLNMKWLGILFAIFASIAAFGIGNLTQVNAITSMVSHFASVPGWVIGIVVTVLTFVVIVGGIKSIGAVTEKLIPFMAIFYVLGCIIILCINASYIGEAIALICTNAFSPRAAGGGFAGAVVMMAIRRGVSRGLFSNESGLGSAPIAAAAAISRNPVRQALVSMTGTFWDTVVICLMTGLMLVTSILRNPVGFEGLPGNQLTYKAFELIPVVGPIILVVGLATFAFSTILGWAYYGERCIEYLFGKKSLLPFRVIFSLVTFVGAITTLDLAWDLADLFNAFMAVPNLVSLLLLSGVLAAETKKYLKDGNLDMLSDEPIPVVEGSVFFKKK